MGSSHRFYWLPGENTKAFVQHHLGFLLPSLNLLVTIVFRALEADRCLMKRQVRRNCRVSGSEICLHKNFGRPVVRVQGTKVFPRVSLDLDNEAGHVVAGVRHLIGVPVDRNCAATIQQDLTGSIGAMTRTQFDPAQTRRSRLESLEQQARLFGKRPAMIGQGPAPLFQRAEMAVQGVDWAQTGSKSLKSG